MTNCEKAVIFQNFAQFWWNSKKKKKKKKERKKKKIGAMNESSNIFTLFEWSIIIWKNYLKNLCMFNLYWTRCKCVIGHTVHLRKKIKKFGKEPFATFHMFYFSKSGLFVANSMLIKVDVIKREVLRVKSQNPGQFCHYKAL